MNYEKKYKEALANARQEYNTTENVERKQWLEELFPELAESKDERIRKELLESFKYQQRESRTNKEWLNGIKLSEVVAWIEKQGDQESIDNVELKFKVGDWIVYKNDICQIVKREDGCNKLVTVFGIEKELVNERNLSTARLWTIEDAKDGDVLLSKHNQPFIYNGIFDEENVGAYCGIDMLGDEFLKDIFSCNWSYKEGVKPTTKEQRDLLFQKMKEAGYEWDADKKELKRLEKQGDKPQGKTALDAIHEEKMNNANKIMAKFKVGDWITNSIETVQITGYDIDYGYQVDYKGNLQHRDTDIIEKEYHLWTIQDAKDGDVLASQNNMPFIYNGHHDYFCSGSYCGISVEGKFKVAELNCRWTEKVNIHPATKEQRDLLFQKMKEAGYEWDANKKELKKFHVIDEGKAEMDYCFTKMMNGEKVSSAWSEEDEKIIRRIDSLLYAIHESEFEDIHAWLKSLKDRVQPQNRWKPSKEQIIALRWILNNIPYNKHKEEIRGLLDQIKDL